MADARNYFVTCAEGLEAVVAAELHALGARDVHPARRGVACTGDPELRYRANLWCRAATRVLELRFTQPLERFRTVQVDLLDGVLGTDQQPLVPWTLTFLTGGS